MEKSVFLLSVLVLICSLTPSGFSAVGDQTPDFCNLSPLPHEGPVCLAYIPQHFYNSTSQKCEQFIYGGCGGNQNRFDSERKCMETCHPQKVDEIKPDTDTCGLTHVTRHYDSKIDSCSLPPDSGPCMAYIPRFFYNDTSGKCGIFIYGGCRGNPNNFKSLISCQANCGTKPHLNSTEVCNLPPETGPCKAYIPQLYYNSESQRCEPFVYGGCDGNDNRFNSVRECLHLCQPEDVDAIIPLVASASRRLNPTEICQLPPKTGPCRAYLERYYFDSKTGSCEMFVYGGCGGNKNNFVSERECLLQCHPEEPDAITPFRTAEDDKSQQTEVCQLPLKRGPCRANIPRYYYNAAAKKCEEFSYGGCHGNQNNFVDEKQCMNKCASS